MWIAMQQALAVRDLIDISALRVPDVQIRHGGAIGTWRPTRHQHAAIVGEPPGHLIRTAVQCEQSAFCPAWPWVHPALGYIQWIARESGDPPTDLGGILRLWRRPPHDDAARTVPLTERDGDTLSVRRNRRIAGVPGQPLDQLALAQARALERVLHRHRVARQLGDVPSVQCGRCIAVDARERSVEGPDTARREAAPDEHEAGIAVAGSEPVEKGGAAQVGEL